MPNDIPAPTAVLTVVFLAWMTGTIVVGTMTRLWGEVHPGHFKVLWLVGAGLSLAAGFGYHPAWIATVLCLATFGLIYANGDRVGGLITAAASVVILAAGVDLSPHPFAAAVLIGTVTNAMLLGHWHLNQPRLGTKPIARLVIGTWLGIGLFVASAIALIAIGRGEQSVRVLGAGTALAFTVFAGVLTAMVQHLVRTRSIMSATGILYLEILLCFVAVFTGSLATLVAG